MFGRAFASESISIHSAMMQKVPCLDYIGVFEAWPISLDLLVGIEEFLLAPGPHSKPHGIERSHGLPFKRSGDGT